MPSHTLSLDNELENQLILNAGMKQGFINRVVHYNGSISGYIFTTHRVTVPSKGEGYGGQG